MATRNLTPVVTCGHPDRKHAGGGLCRLCYTKDWRKKNPHLRRKYMREQYRRRREKLVLDPDKLKAVREKARLAQIKNRAAKPEQYREQSAKHSKAYYHTEKGFEVHRRSRLKKEFGITLEQYDEMHAAQGGLCAICRKPENVVRRRRPQDLCVDHCHETGKIRGLLCQRCNCMIGYAMHDPAILQAAIEFLNNARAT